MVPVSVIIVVFIKMSWLLFLSLWLQRYCGIMCVIGFLCFINIGPIMRRNVVY
jgi:hypothetical protein